MSDQTSVPLGRARPPSYWQNTADRLTIRVSLERRSVPYGTRAESGFARDCCPQIRLLSHLVRPGGPGHAPSVDRVELCREVREHKMDTSSDTFQVEVEIARAWTLPDRLYWGCKYFTSTSRKRKNLLVHLAGLAGGRSREPGRKSRRLFHHRTAG